MLCEILVLKIIFTCIYSSVIILEESDVEPTRIGRKMLSGSCCWKNTLQNKALTFVESYGNATNKYLPILWVGQLISVSSEINSITANN